ncbi:lipoprotein [Glaciecola sp. HTCC2999]|jgi:predicted small lipoprotein YifL|uniref:LPS translocon maturation chaperone LptM n=1 Tax=Glaciecola sp. HTCC2999 TaxID=455436 RepID=UPI0000E105C7|nr:lipoprotein [Glaciecola sp. HTCC2999]
MKFTSRSAHFRQITLVVLLTSVLLGISGCGQKGPLRLPAEPPVQNQPQTQPAAQPTEPETPSNNTNNAIEDKR